VKVERLAPSIVAARSVHLVGQPARGSIASVRDRRNPGAVECAHDSYGKRLARRFEWHAVEAYDSGLGQESSQFILTTLSKIAVWGRKCFEFTDEERAQFREMRDISTDAQGREVLVGLTHDETEEFMLHVRAFTQKPSI